MDDDAHLALLCSEPAKGRIHSIRIPMMQVEHIQTQRTRFSMWHSQ